MSRTDFVRVILGVHHQLVVLLIRFVTYVFSAPWDCPSARRGRRATSTASTAVGHRIPDLFLVHVFAAIGRIRLWFFPVIDITIISIFRRGHDQASSLMRAGA